MNKTKRAIFDAAIQIFSSKGYDSATVDEVVAKAGVAKGTLYYHFKSKEELFTFVVQEGIKLIYEQVDLATKDIVDPLQKLKISAKVQLNYCYENKELFRVILSQIWGDSDIHKEMRKKVRELINLTSKNIEAITQDGSMDNTNSEIFSYCFIGTLFSSALYEILNEDYNHDEVIEKFMNYLNRGFEIK